MFEVIEPIYVPSSLSYQHEAAASYHSWFRTESYVIAHLWTIPRGHPRAQILYESNGCVKTVNGGGMLRAELIRILALSAGRYVVLIGGVSKSLRSALY
jgi:hypothetical protein